MCYPCARARSMARWMTGPSASGIAEGHAQLDHVSAGIDGRDGNVARGVERRVAGGEIDDQARLVIEGIGIGVQSTSLRASTRGPECPCPYRRVQRGSPPVFHGLPSTEQCGCASATACALSSAAECLRCARALTTASSAAASSHETYSARPESWSMACSGPMEA